jgi:hypothetical protein
MKKEESEYASFQIGTRWYTRNCLAAVCSFLLFLTLGGTAGKVSAAVIFDNGNLATGATSKSGVAAPAGTQWSEVQNDGGVTNYANTTAGVSCSVTGTVFRCADDFNVPVGQTWTINQVVIYVYQTGFAGATSPISAATLRIWQGRPGDATSTIVFGDTTTNRLASSVNSNLFRIFNSIVGAGANPPTAPATNRIIWETRINVAPALVLAAGHYWIDWNTQIGATTAHFAPATTIVHTRAAPGNNARQFTGAGWVDSVDAGQTPTGNPPPFPVRQDFPFKLDGSIAGAPLAPRSRSLDFNGDNRTDFVVARSSSAGTQTTWWILDSAGAVSATAWGLGVGFGAGDRPVPGDYDGDGKTDIAVWRPGPPDNAMLFVINSGDSTLRMEPFGQTGDDVSIVGDYDGDGRADPAVYRPGATPGAQSFFYYRGSLNNPGGGITFIPFGLNGDVAIPGDFDGDGRFDFSVGRNEGGQMMHYQMRSTAGFRAFPYGLNTDRFLTGDFDADGRTDIVAVRVNGSNYDWYILRSSDNVIVFEKFGNPATDFLVPGDYDGDNETDLAVWRSGQGSDQTNFFVRNTFASPMQVEWGQSAGAGTPPDYPVAAFSVK